MNPDNPTGSRKTSAKAAKPRSTSGTASATAKRRAKSDTDIPTPVAAKRKSVPPPSIPAPSQSAPDAQVPAAPKKQRAASRRRLKIPPILLEGDDPPPPGQSGPGRRYEVGAPSAAPAGAPAAPELPESYGTGRLLLAARDPRWLYAHWDFSREQLKKFSALSFHGHLVLRVYRGAAEGEPVAQIHLHPESRNWFAPVPAAGAKYVAELGYDDASRHWVTLARSGPTVTPPDSVSDDTSVRFATIPPEVPFSQLLAQVKSALREHLPLVEAMQQMRARGFKDLPAPEQVASRWTPAQEKALAKVVSMDQARRIWIGSLEITELIRRQLQEQFSSPAAGQAGLPSAQAGAAPAISSPMGGAEGRHGFWFNVNAELIVYGATEPDAKVTIADRAIQLHPDGSFSLRFALPDGVYSLPAAAQSADGRQRRLARLHFNRETFHQGDVGAHPQEENLKPPAAEAVA